MIFLREVLGTSNVPETSIWGFLFMVDQIFFRTVNVKFLGGDMLRSNSV